RFLRRPGALDRARRGFDRILARYATAGAVAVAVAEATPGTRRARR
ncbi:MAG: hypothetical protein RLZZ341_353, partial [Pseudomonadota bacterium]